MNKNILVVVGIIVVIGILYILVSNSYSQPALQPAAPTQEQTITVPTPKTITVALSEQNNSGVFGTAVLTEENGKVKVTLTLTGAPQNVTQPAHIHTGSCPNVAGVKYPLTFPVNGTSETMLDVTLDQLRTEAPLGINVHKSAAEAKVYVSCGDLAL